MKKKLKYEEKIEYFFLNLTKAHLSSSQNKTHGSTEDHQLKQTRPNETLTNQVRNGFSLP